MKRGTEFFVGRTLPGKIQLAEPLGAGGFGIAFKAYEVARKNPKEPVVVKLFNRDADVLQVAKFLEEAFHLAQLHHPHIVPVRRVGIEQVKLSDERGKETTEFYPFFVMKYANMGDVRQLKPRKSVEPVPVETVLTIASDIGEALQYAHDAEDPLIHLDVKPENMLRHKHPTTNHIDVLLADFGIAAVAHTETSLDIDTPQAGVGTPPYMAQEQFRGKAVRQTDQYALAVFVYEFLTGRLPFRGEGIRRSDPDTVKVFKWYEIQQNEPPLSFEDALKSTGKGDLFNDRQLAAVLRDLQDVVFKALAKQPEDRYNTVTTFTKTLKKTAEDAAQEKPVGKPFPGVDVPPKKDAPPQPVKILPTLPVVEDIINRCIELYKQEKYPEVLKASEQAIALDPNNAKAWLYKGLSLCTYDKYEEAIPFYDRVRQLDPKAKDRHVYCTAMWNKANCLNKINQPEEALPILDEVLQIAPKNYTLMSNVWLDKGFALSALGKREEAVAAYDQAIRINPNNSEAYYNKGIALSALGKREEAVAAYDQAIKSNPKFSNAYNNKGNALRSLGRIEEAVAAYDQAIRVYPKDGWAYASKGGALCALGKYKEAQVCFQEAMARNPSEQMVRYIDQVKKYYHLS